MKLIGRLMLAAGAGLGTYALTYWLVSILMYAAIDGYPVFLDIAPKVLCLLFSIVAGWTIWKKLRGAKLGWISYMFMTAVLFGGIGLAGGFWWAATFEPDNNLAPIVGIFYTGPMGLALGAICGFLYWYLRRRKHPVYSTHKTWEHR